MSTQIPMTASNWTVASNGTNATPFGCFFDAVGSNGGVILNPKIATTAGETHGSWVVNNYFTSNPVQDFEIKIIANTYEQLRQNSAPNGWEVFWIFTNYIIGADGYKDCNYFILKPNGIEFGNASGLANQTIIYTASNPKINLGKDTEYYIKKSGTSFYIAIDGVMAMNGVYSTIHNNTGSFGLYCEDSLVKIKSFEYA